MPQGRGAEQGDVDGPTECSLALGTVASETRMRVAAQQAACTLPWIGVDDPLEEQRQHNSPELTTHDVLYKRTEAWQISGTSTTATSCVTRSWCRLTCKNLMMPNDKSGAEQNSKKTKSHQMRCGPERSQPPKLVAFAMQADESQPTWREFPIVIQQSPPSVG